MKAWQVFKSRKNWTRGALARDKDGMPVKPRDPSATCFCAGGAIMKVYGEDILQDAFCGLLDYVNRNTKFSGVPGWNDHSSQRWGKVKAVLKKLNI